MEKNRKLMLRIPKAVIDQMVKRDHLSLVGKVQGARLNIYDVRKWTNYKWKLRESLNIIALLNNYLLFIFRNKKDHNTVLSTTWLIGNRDLFSKKWKLGFDPTKERIMKVPIGQIFGIIRMDQ